GLISPLKNHTPFTLVDFRLDNQAVVSQEIPSHYNGLVYVLKGSVKAGDKIINTNKRVGLIKRLKTAIPKYNLKHWKTTPILCCMPDSLIMFLWFITDLL